MTVTAPQEQPPAARAAEDALVALYAWADAVLLADLTRVIKAIPPTPAGLSILLSKARRSVRAVVGQLESATPHLIARLFAATGGSHGGGSGTGGTGTSADDPYLSHADRAAAAIRADLTSDLLDVRQRLTRLPDDVYKQLAPRGAIAQTLDQNITPAVAQALAWQEFVNSGITGFTDRSGREWSLSAYTEMAIRTSAVRAYNESNLAHLKSLGVSYFTVPDDGHPCPRCFPWQNKVLTDEVIIDPVIPVDGTITEARAAGLWHPNCRHILQPVFPGRTTLQPKEWTAADQARYTATQQLRALEVEVRKAKREAHYATDPQVAAEANRDVRKLQARIRAHVALHDLNRRRRREQLDLGDAMPIGDRIRDAF